MVIARLVAVRATPGAGDWIPAGNDIPAWDRGAPDGRCVQVAVGCLGSRPLRISCLCSAADRMRLLLHKLSAEVEHLLRAYVVAGR